MSPSLFLFSLLFPLSTKPSFKAQLQSGRLLECVHAFAAQKLERKKKRRKKIGLICKNAACVKRTRDNYVTPHPHLSLLFFHSLPPSPPPPFSTFTLQNDLLHFTTVDLKTVRVRNVSRSWEYSCSSQWIWGEAWNLFCLLLSRVVKYAPPRWVESGSQWHAASWVPDAS